MLHYCTLEEIKEALATASRFDTRFDGIRQSVTETLNSYIRRRLDYQVGVVEFLDTRPGIDVYTERRFWLAKKDVEPGSLVVNYSPRREWSDADTLLTLDEHYRVLGDDGELYLAGPIRGGNGFVRVVYNGGYAARGMTDAMDCPHALREAALNQCVFEARRSFDNDQGKANDDNGKQQVPIKLVEGLLPETARAFAKYRRLLGA